MRAGARPRHGSLAMDEAKHSGDSPTAPLRIAERYEILELLGRGGMATVYRAHDATTRTLVALKVLTGGTQFAVSGSTVELFEREFHTLVQLAHPRIVRVHDYGVDGGPPYYSMELLDGGDLRELATASRCGRHSRPCHSDE